MLARIMSVGKHRSTGQNTQAVTVQTLVKPSSSCTHRCFQERMC